MHSKDQVREFWERAACGEELFLPQADLCGFRRHSEERYRLEPYIVPFARFEHAREKDVLEIGLGLGADHERFAAAGARLYGIDLTERAVAITRQRLESAGLASKLQVGDAESLPFPNNTFDLVYSWGVIHHSPDTARAVSEIHRVLRPGGTCRVMVYHKYSLVGLMLWLRYGLATGNWKMSFEDVYANYLESPGTKAYTIDEANQLFSAFTEVTTKVQLTHGDLLSSEAGQRHRGPLLTVARRLWPRFFLQKHAQRWGLFMMIEARKAETAPLNRPVTCASAGKATRT